MELPIDLISQFVKTTNDTPEAKKETTVYGVAVVHEGITYVKIDGSELLTPVVATADTHHGDRVTVMIKNHTATVTGNITSPAARSGDVQDVVQDTSNMGSKITEFEIAIGKKVDAAQLNAVSGRIDSLDAETVTIKQNLASASADIAELRTGNLTVVNQVNANKANIENLQTVKLDVSIAAAKYATIENLDTTNQYVHNLEAAYGDFVDLSADKFEAIEAEIIKIEAGGLSTEQLQAQFANIDFSNIGSAAMEYFYSQSGLIENVTIGDATLTGTLIGVTIKGDIIEAGTVRADKLVMLGEDGLYYKLNINGETVESEQTEYNSLNGQVITVNSITAEKIAVDDLVAFDATIGGFNITENSIFSEVKDSEGNTTRGIYMDTDGQVNFGDGNNYIKYYRDTEGNYHLAISADTILYDVNGNQHSLADLGVLGEYVKIGTYDGEPCIELGETDSEFKVFITNTKILFVDSSDALAYFSNQSLYIKKAVIEDELQQGEFVWKVRANGNLGLVWKGAVE